MSTLAVIAEAHAVAVQMLKDTRDGFADSLTREERLRAEVMNLRAQLQQARDRERASEQQIEQLSKQLDQLLPQ